ncbi:MAG TPA: M60 family metallopeptidase [Planctomycetota bacterium]|nr:M60 family metallopeptidase [Planctomycetota bacterium]
MRAFITVPILFAAFSLAASDRGELLNGVKEIAAPGAPGTLSVFGPEAFAVVCGKAREKSVEPVVAAARFGKGRLVAFGHDGYFKSDALTFADTGRLLLNAAAWSSTKEKPRVMADEAGLAAHFKQCGLAVNRFDTQKLSECDVVCLYVNAFTKEDVRAAVTAFVQGGGGLIVAGTGWGWLSLNGGKSLGSDHPGNRTLAPAGIVWADGTLERTSTKGFDARQTVPASTNAAAALASLNEKAADAKATGNEIAQAMWILTQAARALPPDDTLLLPELKKIQNAAAASAIPTPEKPLKLKGNALARLALTLLLEEIKRLPAEKLAAHPAATAFPGAAPKDAPRLERSVTIDTKVPRWHSTGLYAAPGELIRVSVPDAAAVKGFAIRIGAHTDSIAHHDSWSRCPEISRRFTLDAPETRAANPFGGLIYLEVPAGRTGTLEVKIANALPAPHFVLGKTEAKAWREEIRKHPAPWAELETSKVILTVKSEHVRQLDDAEALMKFWDKVMDACAELAAIPLERPSPERFVTDVQISAGFMHSGYPIMTPLSITQALTSIEWMKTKEEPTWGFFHELGHNHQAPAWTFEGTTEVTCNLFTRYVLETVCGVPIAKQRIQGEEAAKALRQHLAGGARFEEWKAKPFVALIMYDQLQKEFGWDAFKKVFAEYRALPKEQLPKNDNEERDQWLTRFSRCVGRNLGPFFEAWGVPTSEAARKSVEHLPAWMPADFPKL